MLRRGVACSWVVGAILVVVSLGCARHRDAQPPGPTDATVDGDETRPSPGRGDAKPKTEDDDVARTARELVHASDIIALGTVTAVRDYTHRDGGMGYDVKIDRLLSGKCPGETLRFRSSGWVGYAKYREGEAVLLFLKHWGESPRELLHAPHRGGNAICYLLEGVVKGPLGDRPLEEYVELIAEATKSLPPTAGHVGETVAVDRDRALAIARAKLATESFSGSIDVSRVAVRHSEADGCYRVDFAWQGAGEITPAQWVRGYLVVVDSESGRIKEANAYKR